MFRLSLYRMRPSAPTPQALFLRRVWPLPRRVSRGPKGEGDLPGAGGCENKEINVAHLGREAAAHSSHMVRIPPELQACARGYSAHFVCPPTAGALVRQASRVLAMDQEAP